MLTHLVMEAEVWGWSQQRAGTRPLDRNLATSIRSSPAMKQILTISLNYLQWLTHLRPVRAAPVWGGRCRTERTSRWPGRWSRGCRSWTDLGTDPTSSAPKIRKYFQTSCFMLPTLRTPHRRGGNMISYLDGIVDIPSIDVAGVALPVDVAEQHGLVAQGEAVEGQALEDILPGMAVHLVQGEAQVPYVLANDVQTIVISGGSRSSNLSVKTWRTVQN